MKKRKYTKNSLSTEKNLFLKKLRSDPLKEIICSENSILRKDADKFLDMSREKFVSLIKIATGLKLPLDLFTYLLTRELLTIVSALGENNRLTDKMHLICEAISDALCEESPSETKKEKSVCGVNRDTLH